MIRTVPFAAMAVVILAVHFGIPGSFDWREAALITAMIPVMFAVQELFLRRRIRRMAWGAVSLADLRDALGALRWSRGAMEEAPRGGGEGASAEDSEFEAMELLDDIFDGIEERAVALGARDGIEPARALEHLLDAGSIDSEQSSALSVLLRFAQDLEMDIAVELDQPALTALAEARKMWAPPSPEDGGTGAAQSR